MGTSLVVISVSPANAQTKADLKAIKECNQVNIKYSTKIYDAILQSLEGETRSSAQMELIESNATPKIRIECKKLTQKSWNSVKSDYIKAIKNAAIELKRIQLKYSELKAETIVCIKDGINQQMTGLDPKCPEGYKELYKK